MSATLLTATFRHLLNREAECRLWRHGVYTWHQLRTMGQKVLTPAAYESAMPLLEASENALAQGNASYFLNLLPVADWPRLYVDFATTWTYIDVESTGLSKEDTATVAVLAGPSGLQAYVADHNLDHLTESLTTDSVLVTFNGAFFDLPLLHRTFPDTFPTCLHLDLRQICAERGHHAGLKRLQAQFGLSRHAAGITGQTAVQLWNDYRRGSGYALTQLVHYCAEDTLALPQLFHALYVEDLRQSGIPLPVPPAPRRDKVFFDNLPTTRYSGSHL